MRSERAREGSPPSSVVMRTISTGRCDSSSAPRPNDSPSDSAMASSTLTDAERKLFAELAHQGIRYLVVGMSAALLQGARGATEDIDLWFEDPTDQRIADAVRQAGSFGLGPPRIGGDELSERLDVVVHLSGLGSFAEEYVRVRHESVDGIDLPVLPLDRILHSKRTAGRPKDLAAIHAIEDALLLLERGED